MAGLWLFKRGKNDKEELSRTSEPAFLKSIDLQAEKDVEKALEGKAEQQAPKRETEPELALWLSNGLTARSLKELAIALKKMRVANYREHVNEERNDIAQWVNEILNNPGLAEQLRKARGKLQAVRCLERELRKKPQAAGAKGAKKSREKRQPEPLPGMEKKDAPQMPDAYVPIDLPDIPEEEREESPERKLFIFRKKKRGTPELQEEVTKNKSAVAENRQQEKPEEQISREKTYKEAELDSKEKELDEKERRISEEEEELNKKRLELTRKRYEIIKQRGEIQRKKFELFMKEQGQVIEREAVKTAKDTNELKSAAKQRHVRGLPRFNLEREYGKEEIQKLLEEAKRHLRENDIGKAKETLGKAQSVLGEARLVENDKKVAEYELLEIEADIKLAALNS